MEIIVAKHAGFCFGVRRAVEMVEELLEKEKEVYSCGPLIHNPQIVEELEKKGFKMIDNPKDIPRNSIFVVRSHGTTPEVVKNVKLRNAKIVNATCPFVKRAQKVALDFYSQNYQVVICGDPSHAEVIGINARTKNTAIIVEDPKKIQRLSNFEKVGVLSQTTQKIELLRSTMVELLNHTKCIKLENTICLDSTRKQNEVKKLAQDVGLMIVVGGKNSSNTTKLAQISRDLKVKTYHIETEKELKKEWFKNVKKVGIAAGASTSGKMIKKVVKMVRKLEH